MRKISVFLLAIAFTGYAHAGSLRCGNYLISPGDPVAKVHKRCGTPTHEEQWQEEYIIRRDLPHGSVYIKPPVNSHLINLHVRDPRSVRSIPPHYQGAPRLYKRSVSVRQWTYNFGSRRFMRQLRFENGILKHIETLKYGYGVYVVNFSNYGAAYGALGGVLLFMFFVWLSSYIFLIGAEVASEYANVMEADYSDDEPAEAEGLGLRETIAQAIRGLFFAE